MIRVLGLRVWVFGGCFAKRIECGAAWGGLPGLLGPAFRVV